MMKQCNSVQRWYRFLVAHRRVSFAALTFIIVSSFAGSLFVSRISPAHAFNGGLNTAAYSPARNTLADYQSGAGLHTGNAAVPIKDITTPVLFVHGISSDNTNCYEYWPKAELYLQGKPAHPGPRFTGPMDTLGYYKGDMNCKNNLYAPGKDWYNKCQSYLDGTSQQDIGTNNDSIRHLACELAWYIYDTYSQHGTNVQLVAYSMGGLITRYALYAVQNSKYFTLFPKYLYVSDVVDFDTPHGGLVYHQANAGCFGGPRPRPLCHEGYQMQTSDGFMTELITKAQNPEGSGKGTHWTLFGVAPSHLGLCDAIEPNQTLYMDAGVKVVYDTCYTHTPDPSKPFKFMMWDTSTVPDATAYYCDPAKDSNCTKNDAQNYTNWPKSTTYPHPLSEMYLSLWQTIGGNSDLSSEG